MLTPLNLTTRVLFGPRATRSNVGVVAPTWPKSSRWAIRASRWPARFRPCVPTWIASSSSRSITETTAVFGHPLGEPPLGVLHGVPALGVAAGDEPADLDEVERQLGLVEVGADGRDEVGEDLGVDLRGLRRIASLSPWYQSTPLTLPPASLHLAEHRAVEALAPLALLRRVPLLHARAAVGGA